MADAEHPAPAPQLELERLLGAWYLLFSDRSDWRVRTHPRVELASLPAADGRPRLRMSARFHSVDMLGRPKPQVSVAEAVAEPEQPLGRFSLRGLGLARVSSRALCVAAVGDARARGYRWAVLWHGRSTLGGAEGIDVCTRDPSISQAQLDAILAAIAEHPVLAARRAGLFATTQHWVPPRPYRFGSSL